MTEVKIARPSDPYDPAWALYNEQNPHLFRSVGAAGDNDDDDAGEGDGEGDGEDEDNTSGEGDGEDNTPGEGDDGDGEDDVGKPGKKPKAADGMSDKEAALLKESMARKKQIKEKDAELAEIKAQLKKFKGIDPEKVSDLLKEKRTKEEEMLAKKGEFDTLKKRMAEEHESVVKAKDEALAEKDARLSAAERRINDLTVGQAFDNDSFIRDKLILTPSKARIVYGNHFDINEDGQIVAYTKPVGAKGAEPLVDAAGDPVPFTDAIKKLVEADPDRDSIVRSNMKPGSGKPADTSAANSKPDSGKPELRGASKIAAGLRGSKK